MSLQHLDFRWSVVFMPTFIVSHTIFPSLVLIVFNLEASPSLHQSWLYANLHRMIHCTYYISFIGLDCVLPWSLSLPSPILIVFTFPFPSPIVNVCQPSSYHCTYYISFNGLDCVLPWSLSFPSPIVTVYQPSSYHSIYYFPSLHQSWLYANLHRIITHATLLPFTNCDCMPTFIVQILHFLHDCNSTKYKNYKYENVLF